MNKYPPRLHINYSILYLIVDSYTHLDLFCNLEDIL